MHTSAQYRLDLSQKIFSTLIWLSKNGSKWIKKFSEIAQFSSALDRLTEPSVPSLSSVVGRVRIGHKGARQFVSAQSGESSPIPTDILIPILNYLFPDAEGDKPTAPYPGTLSQVPEWLTTEGEAGDHPLKVRACALVK